MPVDTDVFFFKLKIFYEIVNHIKSFIFKIIKKVYFHALVLNNMPRKLFLQLHSWKGTDTDR